MFMVVGEALLDLVADSTGRQFTAHPGGSPANVAVGLARLGTSVTLHTQLGDDFAGRMIERHLRDNGVVVDRLPADTAATSLALAALDSDGSAQYDFRIAWDITDFPTIDSRCRCLHTGSIAAALDPGAALIDGLLVRERERNAVIISYDPNIRPSLVRNRDSARTRVEHHIRHSDVVKASVEDVRWLYPDRHPEAVAKEWLKLGPALVVITAGAEGAFAVNDAAMVRADAETVPVVDTVGAGDAFTASLLETLHTIGMLHPRQRNDLATLDTTTLNAALMRANRAAAITCSRPGADPPTPAELASRCFGPPSGNAASETGTALERGTEQENHAASTNRPDSGSDR